MISDFHADKMGIVSKMALCHNSSQPQFQRIAVLVNTRDREILQARMSATVTEYKRRDNKMGDNLANL